MDQRPNLTESLKNLQRTHKTFIRKSQTGGKAKMLKPIGMQTRHFLLKLLHAAAP